MKFMWCFLHVQYVQGISRNEPGRCENATHNRNPR
jgi:hypothetical protein